MGNRTKRSSPTSPTTMVVDSTEVSVQHGCVALRCGPALTHVAPSAVALPYQTVPDLPGRLEEAARAAEQDYWPLLDEVRRAATNHDPVALSRSLERRLRALDWSRATVMAPQGNPGLLHYSGHVALQTDAPFSRGPLRLIFDPLQLHRLRDTFERAIALARAQYEEAPQHPLERAAAALAAVARVPWAPQNQPQPTPEQAQRVIEDLQRDFLGRIPYQQATGPAATTAPPVDTHWTPLLHPCGCTVDWGWDRREMDPLAFIEYCLDHYTVPCPWDTPATESTPRPAPSQYPLRLLSPASGHHAWARPASGGNIPLGIELTRQLAELTTTITLTNPAVLAAGLPPRYCDIVTAGGDDPVRAWTEQRLTDIILNHGRDTLGFLATLTTAPPPASAAQCGTCTIAQAHGGIVCECGHDWTCHPTQPDHTEPCSHCPCTTMHAPGDPVR